MITILCVGKITKDYFKEAMDDYISRISRFDKIVIKETPGQEGEGALKAEAKALLSKIPAGAYAIALDIAAKMYSSEEFAEKLKNLYVSGRRSICFVVGGSEGLDRSVIERCDERISFSKMTFPHKLFRVMLAEQIYRAMKINANQRYHK